MFHVEQLCDKIKFKSKMSKYLLLLLPLLTFLTACSSEDIDDTIEWDHGKNEYNLIIDGNERNFIVHVPSNFSEDSQVPLLFMLHGSTGTGTKFYNISKWAEKSENEGFITVFPTALEYLLLDGKTSTKWSSSGLINEIPPETEVTDDIPFIEELIDLMHETFSVDKERVYISGFSNGGGFVKSQVIPRLGDKIAAANATGGPGLPIYIPIESDRIMPLFNISGTLDDRIWESIGSNEELPIQASEIENHDYIWETLTTMCDILELTYNYEAFPNAPAYNVMVFDNKATPEGSEYHFMMIKELQHRYPNGDNNPNNVIAADILWDWFMQFSL